MSQALHVFLVEDDEDFAYLMRKALERAGHRVTACRTGTDALMVILHGSFDLVILDQRLPDMPGLDVLQSLHRDGIVCPVLMVTGYGDEHLAAQVMRAGAIDYVVKDRALAFLTDLPKRVSESMTRHALEQSNRVLVAATESARDGILITDLQGTIQHVNAALEHMYGYQRDELLGQTPRLFKSHVHGPELFAQMWRTILGRGSWQGELVNKRKDGGLLDTSLTVSPIIDSRGRLTHFVGIYRDISERKQMERQLFQAQKMQSVGTLAGGVAHEFNNLLAGIQGYAALGLREAGLSDGPRQFFDFIVQLSDRAAHLTRQLLAFARKPALSRRPTSLVKLLGATADLVRRSLSIEVSVDAEEKDDALVLADANQLQQVLVNLALNARDALREPAPILFRSRPALLVEDLPAFPENIPAGDYVVLEVADRGTGMTAEVLHQALDPFFTTKEVGQGTGLGLPVAFGIVRAHQGYLGLQTKPGEGTCVTLYLPRLTEDAGSHATAFEVGRVLEPEVHRPHHILVVDDEEAVLDVIRRFLEIAGHQVRCAANVAQGLDLMDKGPAVELVILDLLIPREEGSTNFHLLRQRHPALPILLCTGVLQAEQASPLLQEPAVSLLRKPFKMSELWNAISQLLAGS
jgi:PAS domain S-box-containing protein